MSALSHVVWRISTGEHGGLPASNIWHCQTFREALRRRAAGRRPEPTLAIIDTQSVKCLSIREPRGFDPAKRLVGRKRVAMVDAEGFPLAVAVVPCSVQDHHALPALDQGKQVWPNLRLAILDGVFAAEHCRIWSNLHGMDHHVVRRPPGQKGFATLPRQ